MCLKLCPACEARGHRTSYVRKLTKAMGTTRSDAAPTPLPACFRVKGSMQPAQMKGAQWEQLQVQQIIALCKLIPHCLLETKDHRYQPPHRGASAKQSWGCGRAPV